ncbi:hypothetical protein IQ270_25890 [Microcoleus sp. LEGE 07076]|uniref:hypothetical protein n=1 Tax=Microcoleus sp. LEGE 07076 TaxID=915322 RepID=UPI00187F8F4F|nr:hypothetical protein [Microcoleus sp. LEGE 07076]MBE9187979.1 hypothetical protein [Microcoleus sp. LEGE 07076]
MRTSQKKSNLTIFQMVDRIVASGKIARREHLVLTSTILSDDKISEEERYQINRIFDYIQIGRVKFID